MASTPDPVSGPARELWLTHDGVGLGPLRADLAETYWSDLRTEDAISRAYTDFGLEVHRRSAGVKAPN